MTRRKTTTTTRWGAWQLAGCILAALPLALMAQNPVIINEIQLRNSTVLNGTNTPAWVELYNTTPFDVDLGANGGWSLSDTLSNPWKWFFPAGTILPADSFLLVYLDDRTNNPGLHTMFTLRDTGDDLNLFGAFYDGSPLMDRVVYGFQLTDFSVGRVPDVTGDFRLNLPTPELPNTVYTPVLSTNISINEWMPDPSGGDDWFEIYNRETNIVDISGFIFADITSTPLTNRMLFPLSFIGPRAFIEFKANDMNNWRDTNRNDYVEFKLTKALDRITLYASNRTTLIDRIDFVNAVQNMSEGRLPDGTTNIVRFAAGKSTPGASNFQLITNVMFNEILSHTDPPFEDAIELFNPTDQPADLSNWWLSNSRDDPKKFRIPPGTVILPYTFKVFYEFVGVPGGFNPSGYGTNRSFTLNSARGDEVCLYSASNDVSGTLTGYRLIRDFGPAANSVSFGYFETSDGKSDFVAMSRRTFGADSATSVGQFRTGTGLTNPYPLVGPLVITEIMYHPPDLEEIIYTNDMFFTNHVDDSTNEFVEVYNIASTNVYLYDTHGFYFDGEHPEYGIYADGRTNTWRIRGTVDYNFPTNLSLAPGRFLLVLNFDPFEATNAVRLAEFRSRYRVPDDVPTYGPLGNKLNNSGGSVELHKPDPPQAPWRGDPLLVPRILVDRVKYSDGAPWPTNSDGRGFSLQRLSAELYPNDPANWRDDVPSPGRQNLRIETIQPDGNKVVVGFTGMPNSTYTVQMRDVLNAAASWAKVADVTARPNTLLRLVTNTVPSNVTNRFYRVVMPMQP